MRPCEISVALVLASSAANPASAYYCSRPDQPSVPNGYIAERYEMESAKSEIDSYIDEVNDYLDCLKRESNDIRSEAEDVIGDWHSAVETYNNR